MNWLTNELLTYECFILLNIAKQYAMFCVLKQDSFSTGIALYYIISRAAVLYFNIVCCCLNSYFE